MFASHQGLWSRDVREWIFVLNPSHFNDFIPIPIRNLNPISIFLIQQIPIPSHSHSHSATQPIHLCIYEELLRGTAGTAKRVLAIVILSVCLSRPSTDSSPGEIETPGFHHA